MFGKLETPPCSSEDGQDCVRNVAHPSDLSWTVEGTAPDRIVVTIPGRTVEGYDLGINWWTPSFNLDEISFSHFQPGLFAPLGQGKLEYAGRRDPDDVVATDYSFEVDCQTVGGDDPRNCAAGDSVPRERLAWADTGSFDVRVTMQKLVDGEYRDICDAHLPMSIRRDSTDVLLQASDFAVNANPPVDQVHASWHITHDESAVFPGEDWLLFHRVLVRSFDEFRTFFGYPVTQAWDGSTAIAYSEGGFTMGDPTREASPPLACMYPDGYPEWLTGCTPPPWWTASGDGSARPFDLPEGRQCRTPFGIPGPIGQTKLSDFTDVNLLGCVMNRTHHALLHGAVPGAMIGVRESVFDPVFWGFHKWASGSEGSAATTNTLLAKSPRYTVTQPLSLWAAWEATRADGPPGLSARFPRPEVSLANLSGVLVLFHEDVHGVDVGDLTVNGSPATQVDEDGRWYFFTGFASPGSGSELAASGDPPIDVTVTLASGGILDDDNEPFAGATWHYIVVADVDDDGVPDDRDNCPLVPNTDQRNSDIVMVQSYDLMEDEGQPMYGSMGDEFGVACDSDSDDDGIADDDEVVAGSDPTDPRDPDACPLDPWKSEPGECGCGVWDKDRNGDGEPDCVPPLYLQCSRPLTDGAKPLARDCLFILRVAVGLDRCDPECICAPGGSLPVKASSALRCLRSAVGQVVTLDCPCS